MRHVRTPVPALVVIVSAGWFMANAGMLDEGTAGGGGRLGMRSLGGQPAPDSSRSTPQVKTKILDTLIIEGLVIEKPGVIRNSSGLHQGQPFTSIDVQEAIRTIYRLGLFRSVDFFVRKETDSSASLVVQVDEYPVCEKVEFAGAHKVKLKDLQETVSLKAGQIATDQIIRDNVQAIQKKYADLGYLMAKITPDVKGSKVAGNTTVKFVIEEGVRVRVRRVTFVGNEVFKERRLKYRFKTKEDRWWRSGKYDESAFGENLDSLMLYYQDHGYLDARVTHDSVWYSASKRDIYIIVQVDEGKRYYTGDFFFAGNKVVSTDTLKDRITLKHGAPFERKRFLTTKNMIEDAYREEGYLWVQVDDQRAFRGDTIDVTLSISEGRPAIVRKIDITGNTKTHDEVIRRNIVLTPGQKYRQSLMARSVREINQLNYFNNVTPDLKPNDDGTIDLVFNVQEKDNIGQLSIGAAYSEQDKFVGTFSTSIPNFRGRGQQLDLNVEYGKYKQDYSLGFKEPWAFNRPITLQASIYYDYTKYADLSNTSTESYGLRIGLGRKLTWPDDYFRLDGLYQLSRETESQNTIYSTDSTIMVPHTGVLSRLTLTLYRNDTDVPLFPNKGSVFSLRPEIAGLGGDYQYFKTTATYDWYFPLFWKLVFGFKSKFGVVNKLPWSDKLVISQFDLYNAGGVYTDGIIRGFPEYTFGGRVSPSDGKTMLTFSSMLQFPIMEQQLYFSVFGDMGNTWESVSQVNPADMYKGVGFGLRLQIPMLGLMGFDFAWRLDSVHRTPLDNDPGSGANRFEFHFLMNRGF